MNQPSIRESAERRVLRRMVEWSARRSPVMEDDRILPTHCQCPRIAEAMNLLEQPDESEKLRKALELALAILAPMQGGSREASDEFVAMYGVLAGVDNGMGMDIIEAGLKVERAAPPAPEPVTITTEESLTYETAVGEAGSAYLRELVRDRDGYRVSQEVWLPGTFRWEELFNRMNNKAREVRRATAV